jgi:exosortase A
MIWRNRARLATVTPRVSILGLATIVAFGGVWFLGRIASIQLIEQLCLIGMVLGAVWAVLGWPAVRLILFPLLFLFLAVPLGEGFFPILISIAGRLGVTVLQITGTPVGYDGHFIRVPYGEWAITEACSGLRFLLSVLTVGAVFAYTNYSRAWKRVAFFAFCVVAAILNNGLRIWILVLVGIYTKMKSPLVHDHRSLGWVLFAIMVTVIFALGRRFSDPESVEDRPVPPAPPAPARRMSTGAFAMVSLLVLAIGAACPVLVQAVDRPREGAPPIVLDGPADRDGWTTVPYTPLGWRPHYVGAKATLERGYVKPPGAVGLYVLYYRDQRQGAELERIENGFRTPTDYVTQYYPEVIRDVPGADLTVGQTEIRAPGGRLLAWRWFWTGSRYVAGGHSLKLDGLKSKLTGRGDDAAVLVLCAPFEEKPEEATEAMTAFLSVMKPDIDREIRRASGL